MAKEIVYIFMKGCPYCRRADIFIEELRKAHPEYGDVKVTRLEDGSPEAQKYGKDYYYVPSMFVEGQKLYEAHPGETEEECRDLVRKTFEAAV